MTNELHRLISDTFVLLHAQISPNNNPKRKFVTNGKHLLTAWQSEMRMKQLLDSDGLGGSEPLYEMSREVFERGELSQDIASNDSISQADTSSSQKACDRMVWLQSSPADGFRRSVGG